jgi:hypothetical protein
MFTIDWVTRRYQLPNFKEADLRSAVKSWVPERGCSVVSFPKYDLVKRFWSTSYNIAESKVGALTALVISLYVSYRPPTLYVFAVKDRLPAACSSIFDEVFAAYVQRQGGERFEETPLVFSTSIMMTSPLSHFESLQVDYRLLVQLDPELHRIEAAGEEVHIPQGVSVSIKRSRTITHSVEITESEKLDAGLEASFTGSHLGILKATISSEIQKQTGTQFQESETVEHQINLSGDKCQNYKLVWADFVRSGTVEVDSKGTRGKVPFTWRERTELQVVPT